jgi:hypothetical protein
VRTDLVIAPTALRWLFRPLGSRQMNAHGKKTRVGC